MEKGVGVYGVNDSKRWQKLSERHEQARGWTEKEGKELTERGNLPWRVFLLPNMRRLSPPWTRH